MNFQPYPFEKLTQLLSSVSPSSQFSSSVLTIGEPQFETPNFIQEALKKSTELLNKYPKSVSETYLKNAMLQFVQQRCSIELEPSQLIASFGTRELLFNFPQYYLFDKTNPTVAFPNPFYQIYEGAAIASRARILHMDLTKDNDFKASLDDQSLQDVDLVILNYPNNPTASTASMNELVDWVNKALEYDFVLINDECYIDIYFDDKKKPISILEASIKAGNSSFKNILSVHSLSKRSSAPGLRSGFIAGDEQILNGYKQYRTYVGCASPLPLQKAAAKAWANEEHVEHFRELYRKNFQLANDILGLPIPDATFYVWLEVDNDVEFTQELYAQKNIKVLPGSFLGRNGIGKEYIRMALVEPPEKTEEILKRLKDFMNGMV